MTAAAEHALSAAALRTTFVRGIPVVGVACGGGLLLLSYGLHLSRSDPASSLAELWFWLGLMAIVLPCAVFLAGRNAARAERLAIVVMLAVLFYLVKVVHDPFAFTYADEPVHVFNVKQILLSGSLFHPNPIISVTSRFPGLEGVTAGVGALTGLSVFVSGLLVVGVARLVLILSLFHLFERLSGSARVAGIAVVVYAANPNFLFWSAQFSYESLGLPLVAFALYALTERMDRVRRLRDAGGRLDGHERAGWTLVLLLTVAAVAITHHVSAYVLSGAILAICVVAAVSRRSRPLTPWLPAVMAVGATVGWLVGVAPQTVEYLSPVLGRAFHQTIDALTGSLQVRAPFAASGPATLEAPIWERVIAIASVGITVTGIGFALFVAHRRLRAHPVALTLALAGVAYVAILPMRLVPAAWETSNRASEFLFIGVSLLLAVAALHVLDRRRWAPLGVALLAGVLTIGGVAAGWPPRVLLALPYRVSTGTGWMQSQSHGLARATRRVTPLDSRFIAPEGDGRVLVSELRRTVFVTSAPFAAASVLFEARLTSGLVSAMAAERIRYVVVDRREQGDDSMEGFFFVPPTGPEINARVAGKYDGYPDVDRLVDTGDIALYDVGRLWGAPR